MEGLIDRFGWTLLKLSDPRMGDVKLKELPLVYSRA